MPRVRHGQEHAHDEPRNDDDNRPPGPLQADEHRPEGQHGGPQIHQQDGSNVGVTMLQEAVVKVLLVCDEEPGSPPSPPNVSHDEVEDRDREHHERDDDREVGCLLYTI